ncbi:MAG TPA: cyclic nucleotide-binding domain-containing protein [Acidimicrobiia bacterium]|nr:cyclic nucleotide-binding domain-containing protein [Acidimicrobiia bacterium]
MRRTDPKIQLLRRVGLRDETDRELAELAPLVDEVEFDVGDVLMEEGRTAFEAFIIVEGTASVSIDAHHIATLGPGEMVGEMALLDHSPRSATVTAATPMRLLAMDPRSFASLLRRPTIGWRVAAELAQRLRRAEGAPTFDDRRASGAQA